MRLFGLLSFAALTACTGTAGTTPATDAPTNGGASGADKAIPASPREETSNGDPASPQPMMVRSQPADKPVAKKVAWTTIEPSIDDPGAVRTAARSAKGVPVVYVGATWCGPCKIYKGTINDPRMVRAHLPVHIIELDADRHPATLKELAIAPTGIPHWEMVDKTGTSSGKKIDGSAWDDNTVEKMAPALTRFFTGG